jgi:hypothetical protein
MREQRGIQGKGASFALRGEGLASTTRFLVLALSALYLLAAVGGLAFLDFDTTGDLVLWLAFLCGGAALMLLGQLTPRLPPWLSAALISIGAAAGGLPLFWTIIVPVAVATVVGCTVALARRPAAPA